MLGVWAYFVGGGGGGGGGGCLLKLGSLAGANGSVTETQISTVSDTGYLFLGIGMLVCFVGLIVSVSLFVSSRSVRRRPA